MSVFSCQKEKFIPPESKHREEDFLKRTLKETEEIVKKTKKKNNFDRNDIVKPETVEDIQVRLANKYKKEGKYKKALIVLLDLYKEYPESINILENISQVYSALKDFENSKKYALKILELDKENLFALTVIANFYAHKKEYKKAIEHYIKIANISPAYNVLHNIGVLYEKQGRLKEAFKYYKKASRVNPSQDAFYSLALISQKLNDKDNSLEYLIKADRRGFSLKIKKMLALEYIKQNKFDEAVKVYLQIIDKTNALEDYNNLASAYLYKKRYGKAEEIYKKALKYYPQNPRLLYNLALCYYKMKKPSKMLRIIREYEKVAQSITSVRKLKVYLGKISK